MIRYQKGKVSGVMITSGFITSDDGSALKEVSEALDRTHASLAELIHLVDRAQELADYFSTHTEAVEFIERMEAAGVWDRAREALRLNGYER